MSTTESSLTRCAPAEWVAGIELLAPREVPLGGPRAMSVRRLLPHRDRSFIGAWCFVDHYGPDDVTDSGGMDVPPHPHTGLATVSWLFEGEIEHRDSAGVHAMVLPGECNLMTAGSGIAHSEVSTPATSMLHGLQLWLVLPEADAGMPRAFQHYAPPVIEAPGTRMRVFVGSVGESTSTIVTQTPLMAAEICLEPGAAYDLVTDASFEYGVLVDEGEVSVDGEAVPAWHLGYREPGPTSLRLVNEGAAPARLVVLGGVPFEEEIIMWWNFIGRTTEEIAGYREQWQARSERFGEVEGYGGRVEWLPAPELPAVTLRPRGRRRS